MGASSDGKKSSDFPVGYGSAGVDALEFSLDDGLESDIGFLKLFVSSTYIDMRTLEQLSPLERARKATKKRLSSASVWDTWTYVLKTQRKGVEDADKRSRWSLVWP